MLILYFSVHRVDSLLQLVPGQQIFSRLLLQTNQTPEVPEDMMIIITMTPPTDRQVGRQTDKCEEYYLSSRVWSTSESPAD